MHAFERKVLLMGFALLFVIYGGDGWGGRRKEGAKERRNEGRKRGSESIIDIEESKRTKNGVRLVSALIFRT